ncbi:phosphoribosyltransferase-like protein [Streptococcus caprae]|uniref:PRTase-CE domain-containing protein n=1 Tax=Streptococcus caprae TaxID=1640501 RepID=A0ABV8CZ12_9STRE
MEQEERRQEFSEIVDCFFKRNNLSPSLDEHYLRHFRRKFGRFLSQIPEGTDVRVKNMILMCIRNDYIYYSRQKIVEIFRAFHRKLMDNGVDIDSCLFASVLNKQTHKHNSSIALSALYLEANELDNRLSIYFNSIIDIEMSYRNHLNGKEGFEHYNQNIFEKESHKERSRCTKLLRGKKYLLLLDDYTGTGGTIRDFLQIIHSYLPEGIFVIVFCIHATEDAKIILENTLRELNITGQFIKYESSTKYFRDNPELERIITEFESTVVHNREDNYTLGYNKTESVVTTYRNTPNNTLSLFWRENLNEPVWYPIFPRSGKSVSRTNSRWVACSNQVRWFLSTRGIVGEEQDKLLLLMYLRDNSRISVALKEIELDKILCYNPGIIQECQTMSLVTDNLELTPQGLQFLSGKHLDSINLTEIEREYEVKALKQDLSIKIDF